MLHNTMAPQRAVLLPTTLEKRSRGAGRLLRSVTAATPSSPSLGRGISAPEQGADGGCDYCAQPNALTGLLFRHAVLQHNWTPTHCC